MNALDYGVVGDGLTDDTAAIRVALAAASVNGADLFFPAGDYLISETIIIPPGVEIYGEGKSDRWAGIFIGTTFRTTGTGNADRWTDITGSDAADDTPVFVAGGNGVYLRNMAVVGDWSIGVLFPCVKQCGVSNFFADGFTDACVYLDATWSDRNATMQTLHPSIEPSTGMNEFFAEDFWLIGGGGTGFGFKIQGTTRAGDSVSNTSDWQWGWGGTSDIRLHYGRLSATSGNGGAFSMDVQLFGETTYGQGVSLRDIGLRVSGAKYVAKLDRVRRIVFDGCYSEGSSSNSPVFAVTSRTLSYPGSVIRDNDRIHNYLEVDGTVVSTGGTGSGGSDGGLAPWTSARNMSVFGVDGRIVTPNIFAGGPSATGADHALELTTFSSTGTWFSYDNGTTRTKSALLSSTVFRPAVHQGFNLGTTSFNFGAGRFKTLYAETALVVTSDERLKKESKQIADPVLRAWAKVNFYQYRLKEGDNKIKFGVLAQEIIKAFESEGLDPFAYDLLYFDQWEDEYDDEGNLVKEAGDKYSVNYTEALVLECAINRLKGL